MVTRETDKGLNESLHGDLVAQQSLGRPDRPAAAETLSEMIWLGLFILLLGLWMAGACAGIVGWALEGSLSGVIVSALMAGLGVTSTLWLFVEADAGFEIGSE